MKKLDLTGQTFGKWLVRAENKTEKGTRYWFCLCTQCNITEEWVNQYWLSKGKTTCCIKCSWGERIEDLTGQVFNKWLVIGPWKRGTRRKILYPCRCTGCNESEQWIPTTALKSGKTGGCRKCANVEMSKDLAGQQFGNLSVIQRVEKPEGASKRGGYWLCRCSCGREEIINVAYLSSGKTRHCSKCPKRLRSDLKDMAGRTFSKMTVTDKFERRDSGTYWLCVCKCGFEKYVRTQSIVAEIDVRCENCVSRKEGNGVSYKPEYQIWRSMKERCNNEDMHSYANYGGRGIKVCSEWMESFEAFYKDMGDRPSDKHQLDRINVNGNYEKSNCRWLHLNENALNKRNTRYAELDGVVKPLIVWSRELGINYKTTSRKIRKEGLTLQEIINKKKGE